MKVVILAGGLGTRISEESHLKPKPMIEIGDKPILWHIMKFYSAYGINDFIICCGYKSYIIKEYFSDYYLHNSDVTFDFRNGNVMETHSNTAEPWRVTLVDTGLHTMTGGRIKQIQPYVENETFMLTYGDGVSDIDINKLLKFHEDKKKILTITTIQPEGRFGVIDMEGSSVLSFREKSKGDMGWINAGFMVIEPKVFDYLNEGDNVTFEKEPMEEIAKAGQLVAYKHYGFWQCMDTQRDKQRLEELWDEGKAPWKVW